MPRFKIAGEQCLRLALAPAAVHFLQRGTEMKEVRRLQQRYFERIPKSVWRCVCAIVLVVSISAGAFLIDQTRSKVLIVNATENEFHVFASEFPYHFDLLNAEVILPQRTRELWVKGGRDVKIAYHSKSVDGRIQFVWLRTWGSRICININKNAKNELSISSSPLREWFDAHRNLPFPESWL